MPKTKAKKKSQSMTIWTWLKRLDRGIPGLVIELLKGQLKDYVRSQRDDFRTYRKVRMSHPVVREYPRLGGLDEWREWWWSAEFVFTHGTPTRKSVLSFLGQRYAQAEEDEDDE